MSESTDLKLVENSRVTLCPDGKYRWVYEFPMLKNPTILFTVWKVMGLAAMLPALIILLGTVGPEGARAIKVGLIVFAITLVILFVLSILAYLLLAALFGWKYVVLFEMDEETITHAQLPKQYTLAEGLGWLSSMAAMKAGNPALIGGGLLAASHQMTVSDFESVSRVIGMPKRNTIRLNQYFAKNQIYVVSEDYDFLWNYITSRTVNAKIR